MFMSESGSKNRNQASDAKSNRAHLLKVRKNIKARTPEFRRFESWRYVRIHSPWRKPKGIDNHMRLSVKGWPHLVRVGYRVPKEVRYLHPSGYRDVLVHNLVELEQLSPVTDAARLASGLGRKKRIELAKRARELGLRILNGRNLLIGQSVKDTPEEEQKSSEKRPKKPASKSKS